MPQDIAYRTGAYRAVAPERTWARVAPTLGRFGITRVADLTGLDEIGLPVYAAYRPTGLTYAVSMGMGVSAAHARVGAVMESIESWHAENLRLPVTARGPAARLGLGYDVRGLDLAPRSPLTDSVVLDWTRARGLLTGRPTLAPIESIRLDGTAPRDWADMLFRPGSEGLATGNTETEAALHGLLELVERAALAGYRAARAAGERGPARSVDPDTCRDPVTRRIYQAVREAGCTVWVRSAGGPTGLPCFLATVWSPEMPVRCVGHACHVRAELALGRALGEAVLTRLAAISGARDDIDGIVYREMAAPPRPAEPAGVSEFDHLDLADDGSLESVLRHCAGLVAAVTGVEPFVVRLTREDVGIPAVKVFAPGLRRSR